MYTYASIFTHMNTHTYTVHTYICEKEKANHKVERSYYEHYTHMYTHTNIQRKKENISNMSGIL